MLLQNQSAKVAIAHLPSVQDKIETTLFFLLLLFLPTQFGKHFWPSFSFVLGQRIDYLSPTLYITDILFILLLAVFFVRKVSFFRTTRKTTYSLFLLLFIIINITFAQSPQEGFYGFFKLFEIGFLTYYTGNILRTNLKIILFPLTFGIILESVLATVQFSIQSSLNGIFYYLGERTFTAITPGIANASINGQLLLRPYGTFSHPNVLAGYLVIGMTILCSQFFMYPQNTVHGEDGYRSMVKRLFFIITLLTGTIGVCLTLSRVAILVWGFVCMFLLIRYFQKKLFTKKILLIIHGLLIIFVITLFTISPLVPRFSQLTLQDESVVLREQLALDALIMLFSHPVFGVGLNNFLIALPHYDVSRGSVFSIQPVHNIFLLIGAETGFIGLWLFISFVIWLYIRLIKFFYSPIETSLKPVSILGIVLLTEIVLLGSFDHYFLTIQQGQLLFGLGFGIIIRFSTKIPYG